METCLSKTKNIDLVYTLNEPAAAGAAEALKAAGVKATIVSVDGGCSPGIAGVKSGVIGATAQQYPVKMADRRRGDQEDRRRRREARELARSSSTTPAWRS